MCTPIQSHELYIAESTKMRLNESDLEDTYHRDDEVLIGIDYYWSIVMVGNDQNEFVTSSNS